MTDLDHWQNMFLVKTAEGVDTLSFSRTPTVLLTFAANLFTRKSAVALTKQFGIGAMDWRMLVMLTRHPGASVAQSAETIGIDKAAVSRSLGRLLDKQLVKSIAKESDPRRKQWMLTAKRARACRGCRGAFRTARCIVVGVLTRNRGNAGLQGGRP